MTAVNLSLLRSLCALAPLEREEECILTALGMLLRLHHAHDGDPRPRCGTFVENEAHARGESFKVALNEAVRLAFRSKLAPPISASPSSSKRADGPSARHRSRPAGRTGRRNGN